MTLEDMETAVLSAAEEYVMALAETYAIPIGDERAKAIMAAGLHFMISIEGICDDWRAEMMN